MRKRIPVGVALAGLALTGMLCACGSAAQAPAPSAGGSSSPAPVSAPPVSAPPVIAAVRLGRGFQPRTLRISPGQQFTVIVDPSVRASGPGLPNSCSSVPVRIDGGMLTVRCTSGAFSYTALRPGTAELAATVRPRCAPGSVCPQWVTAATLKITIV